MNTPTRGIRNNNPGNIDRNQIQWQGMAADQSGDSRFIVFSEPKWGIRAIAKILNTYSSKFDLNTVREIVQKWAPPSENNTTAYINAVAAEVGVDPDKDLDDTSKRIPSFEMTSLVHAIIVHENGYCPYTASEIFAAVELAR